MRLAVIVAPMDSEPGLAMRAGGDTGWLAHALVGLGFEVVVVEGGAGDSAAGLAEALAFVGPDDTVLVHASGTLGGDASIRLGRGDTLAVSAIAEAIGAHAPRAVLVMVELLHDSPAEDEFAAAEHVEGLRAALDARARGHAALVAVRAASRAPDPLALTRRMIGLAEEARRAFPSRGAMLSDVVDRLHDAPDPDAAACFALVKGATDFPLAAARTARTSARPASVTTATADEEDAPRLDLLLELADGARDRGVWDHARAGYQAALLVTGDDGEMRARVLVRIGQLALARGRTREAERAFDKALLASPDDRASLDALITLATDATDWAKVDELRSRRIASHATHEEQAEELFAIAWTRIEKLGDVPRGIAALETARALDSTRADVLEALRRAYLVLERWPDVLDTTSALAAHATSRAERAARRYSQARIAHKHLKDEPRAVAFLEETLDDDPTHSDALGRLIALRLSRGEPGALVRTLAEVAERLDAIGEPARADEVRARRAAIEASAPYEGAAQAEPEPPDAVSPEATPLDARAHARQYARHARAGRWDVAYLSALALEELGATDEEHRATLDRHRPEGLAIRSPLDDLAWSRLRAPGSDIVLESLFRAIARAATAASVEERRARRSLVALDPARLLPPTSTASIARTFQWAARVVGVPCPRLYVIEDVPGDIAAVAAPEPSTVLGPGVLSGRTTKELAFAAGRHLAYYRPEHAVLLAFPTLQELTILVLAALQVALPEMPIPPAAATAVDALRVRLTRHMTPAEHAAVVVAVGRIDARQGRVGLAAWTRSVELTAARAGLLLCGDLRTVMGCLRRSPRNASGLTLDDARADLVAFCTSTPFAELRNEFAVLPGGADPVSGSTPPPPSGDRVVAPRRREREAHADVDPGP